MMTDDKNDRFSVHFSFWMWQLGCFYVMSWHISLHKTLPEAPAALPILGPGPPSDTALVFILAVHPISSLRKALSESFSTNQWLVPHRLHRHEQVIQWNEWHWCVSFSSKQWMRQTQTIANMKRKHDKTKQISLFSYSFTKKQKETPDILSMVTRDDELTLPSSSAAISPSSPPVSTPSHQQGK